MSLKEKRSETLVGVFILIGMLALAALVVQFGRSADGNVEGYTVYVEFQDASGLIKGSDVRMGGAKIGKVITKPELTDELTVIVELKLDKRIRVYSGSRFMVQSVTLLGDKMIVVVPPELKDPQMVLSDGSKVKGGGAGGLDALQSDAESVARDARKLMRDARTSLLKVDAALDDIRMVVGRFATTVEKLNNGAFSDKNLNNFENTLSNLEDASSSLKSAGDELKPALVEIRSAVVSVKKAAVSVDDTFATINEEIQQLTPAFETLPETLTSFRDTAAKASLLMDNVSESVKRAQNGNGLFATLVDDEEVGADAKTFIRNLKHYGVLRYRDDSTFDERDPKQSRYRGMRR